MKKDIYEYVYPNERQITMASSLVKFWSETRSHSPLLNTFITPSLGLDPPYRRTGISEIKMINLDLQLLMQSVPITIDVVSSNLDQGEVLVGKVCKWLETGQWFSPGPPFSPPIKLTVTI